MDWSLSNEGTALSLEAVCKGLSPQHRRQPGELVSCHKLNGEAWLLDCVTTWPSSLYSRLAHYANVEDLVGGYMVNFHLSPRDSEIKHGV